MRGRLPSGPEFVAKLPGHEQAKQRLQIVLETLAGTLRVQDACARLNLSEQRFEQLRIEALGDAVLGLFIVAITGPRLGLHAEPVSVAFLFIAVFCGALLYTAIFTMLATVSFWMEDKVGVMPPVYNLIVFGRYPLDIYNGFLRVLLSWVIPFGFATFYPAAAVLRGDAYRIYAWLMPLVTAAFCAMALWVWNRGIRSYSSTGS